MCRHQGDDVLAHLDEGETSCVLLSLQITLSTQQIKSNIFHSGENFLVGRAAHVVDCESCKLERSARTNY